MESFTYTKEVPEIKYIDKLGNYNQLPTPRERIDFKQFYRTFLIYSPSYIDYRQIVLFAPDGDIEPGNYRLYFYGTEGYAVSWNQDNPLNSVVYRLGCKHLWKLVRSGRCYYEYKCTKCGAESTVDTSD